MILIVHHRLQGFTLVVAVIGGEYVTDWWINEEGVGKQGGPWRLPDSRTLRDG